MIKSIREKIVGFAGSLSGLTSVFGSWQVCHNVCLGIVTLLSLIGITVVGMPLLFLQKVALPFWIAAAVLFIITLFFYVKKKCIALELIILNSGLLVMGIPFLQQFAIYLWIIGGLLIITAAYLFVKKKIRRRKSS